MGYIASLQQDEQTARRILDAAERPSVILGYELMVGDIEGAPALFVTFQTTVGNDAPRPEIKAAATALNKFVERLRGALLDANPDLFPYFDFRAARV